MRVGIGGRKNGRIGVLVVPGRVGIVVLGLFLLYLLVFGLLFAICPLLLIQMLSFNWLYLFVLREFLVFLFFHFFYFYHFRTILFFFTFFHYSSLQFKALIDVFGS